MVIKASFVGVDVMGGLKQLKNYWFFSLKIVIVMVVALIIWGAMIYNRHVILYEKQLNILVNYIYDEVSPDDVTSVYQRFINLDSDYGQRIKKDLGDSLISRYQYYANLYMLRKIEYEEYLQYEQIIEPLFFSSSKVIETIDEVSKYYQSQRAYIKGVNLQQQGFIEEAIEAYGQVMFNDQSYYELAKGRIMQCVQLIKEQYLMEANEFYEQKNYVEAIKRLNYLIDNENDEGITSLRWYYQSEFYLEVMKEIEELIENNQLGFVINFLQEIEPYLGSSYEETLHLKLSEVTLQRAQRRDKALGKYAGKIQVLVNTESNQQVITYNQLALQSSTAFNPVNLATYAFTNIKKGTAEGVDKSMVEQNINVMPYIVANSDITSATMPVVFGYYGQTMNDFDLIELRQNGEAIVSFEMDPSEKRQVWIEDEVIEWITIELSQEEVEQVQQLILQTSDLEIVFKGKYLDYQAPISTLERDLLIMMFEIYQSIVK